VWLAHGALILHRITDPESHVAIELDEARKKRMISRLQTFYSKDFDEELSAFRAEQLLDFMLTRLGPQIYNQGVEDARVFFQQKLEDLDAEIHERDEA
jgi:uncharacterized protein (DUF2164 family)